MAKLRMLVTNKRKGKMAKGVIESIDKSPLPISNFPHHTLPSELYRLWCGVVQKSLPFFIQHVSHKKIIIRFNEKTSPEERVRFVLDLTDYFYGREMAA